MASYKGQEEAVVDAREIVLAEGIIEAFKAKEAERCEELIYKYSKVTSFEPVDQRLINGMKKHMAKVIGVLEGNGLA